MKPINLFLEEVRGWQTVGDPPPEQLWDARVQIHWAAQIVAAANLTFLEPVPDDSHTAMTWVPGPDLLAGHLTPEPNAFRLALRPADLTLLLLSRHGGTIGEFTLPGRTLEDGHTWLRSALAGYTGRPLEIEIKRPTYQLPQHRVSNGQPFSLHPANAFAAVARWFGNAHLVLGHVTRTIPTASSVRCWPHHLDLATLIHLDPEAEPEKRRFVGVGLAPGDDYYREPYWYASPWPYPKTKSLPELEGDGEWKTDGTFMAALPASRVVRAATPEGQLEKVTTFLQSAVEGCYRLLEA